MGLKRGDKFTHAKWLDEHNKPLRCEVTRVAHGVIYWKGEGERKAKFYFKIEHADQYIKR